MVEFTAQKAIDDANHLVDCLEMHGLIGARDAMEWRVDITSVTTDQGHYAAFNELYQIYYERGGNLPIPDAITDAQGKWILGDDGLAMTKGNQAIFYSYWRFMENTDSDAYAIQQDDMAPTPERTSKLPVSMS